MSLSQKEATMTLKDKRIIVLGGTSGIGLAVAEAAATDGAQVLVASSDDARVKRALTILPASAEGHLLDLSNATAIEAFFDAVGPLDHLVYTAGESLKLSPLAEGDIASARHFFELRYWGRVRGGPMGAPPDPDGRLDRVHIRRCGGKARTGVVCRGEYLWGDGGADTSLGGRTGAGTRQHRLPRRRQDTALA
jgi:hypothetical protein